MKAAKIEKHVPWQVFRHSYASLLNGNGEDTKVVEEALLHASPQITADTYVQAISKAVRAAQRKVVEQLATGADSTDMASIGPGYDPDMKTLPLSR